jgi:ribosome biogenesis protein BMS1
MGWRRFQSLPVFTTEDPNERERFLKYTPEHMHCTCSFYGPLVPPNSGILAFQGPTPGKASVGFRIGMTGTVLESQCTPSVVKKLKLVGTPVKIFRNTAFITGMFNSALEVAKFEGAKIKTVSGIRGQIKKAVRDGEPGRFRATFEDKILMSDIVTCRLWVPVEVRNFYNPMLSLLSATIQPSTLDDEEGEGDSRSRASKRDGDAPAVSDGTIMRPISQIRRDEQVPIPVNKDSLYKPIVRAPREFKKLTVSKKLQAALPFKSKPKMMAKAGGNSSSKGKTNYIQKRAVILEPEDRDKRAAVQMLSTITADKVAKRKVAQTQRSAKNLKAKERESDKFADVAKELKKRNYRDSGKEKAGPGRAGAKRRKM